MTAEAGERFAGLTVMEAREAVVAALEAEGRIVAREDYVARGALLAPLGAAHRAADLAAVVHAHGRARRAGDRGGARRARAHHPRRPAPPLPGAGWRTSARGASRASCGGATGCRCTTATTARRPTWPPQPPAALRRSAAGSCARTRTCSTPGSPRRCGRSPRSAGPTRRPSCARSIPTDVLSTARDILFLWVARMIMMGLEFTGEAPFSDVYVHSVILAPDGRRMSKSLGNGIDPLDEIERHGADAVRFGLLAMSSTQDVRYSAEKVQQGQALANKLFNAARFVLAARAVDPSVDARAAGRARSRIAGSSRACSASRPTPRARIEGFDFSHAALGPLRLRLRRAVRLVPGAGQAPPTARGARASERAALSATLLHVLRRDAGDRPPGDPVRHRGAVGPPAGGSGTARGSRATRRPIRR